MARKRSELRQANERQLAAAQLQVVLDNMPGALAYTDDDLNIVLCNDQFREMYPVPDELLQPGRPYPVFLRYLAENGYYGEGDPDDLVAVRVNSLRNPSGKTYEIRLPTDGSIVFAAAGSTQAASLRSLPTSPSRERPSATSSRRRAGFTSRSTICPARSLTRTRI